MDDAEEQLRRAQQTDEFRVLKECFTNQLVDLRKSVGDSRKEKKKKRHTLTWVPLELSVRIKSRPEPIAEFDLYVKCTKKYPLLAPAIGFKNVKGVGRALMKKLHRQLKSETANEELLGQGCCIALLIMQAQQFLEDHYRELELNNKSFYEQMVEQKQNCDKKAEISKKHRDEIEKIERERQVEEFKQKLLKKRELFNESKKRRDSQNSNSFDGNDIEDLLKTYDYVDDLDAESTTGTSVADDEDGGEIQDRLSKLDESVEDEETLVTRSRRSTFVGQSRELRSSGDDRGYNQSRLDLEYEVIEKLGRGGFGTVYKVRNRVDSRLYALKKVRLNPDNETLNEKIMREVKLLSRLNHENVIRYYTAWNEIETRKYRTKALDSASTTATMDDSLLDSRVDQKSCILSQRTVTSSSDDDNSDDDIYHTSYLINDNNIDTSANFVVFETGDNKDENEIVESMKKALGPTMSDEDEDSSDNESKNGDSKVQTKIRTDRWLYIQMELGQGTLREAIDKGLPKQKDRARRFLGEILDGLCHIHRQGIIHRDLKPVNIFLDSMDRPKIGDFGLATTNLFIITQSQGSSGVPTAIKPNRKSLERLCLFASPEQAGNSPGGESIIGESLNKSGERLMYIHANSQTDNIGTPLYMSPELSATSEQTRIAKVVYNHKVDVYSLGIIYFEMLYAFETVHERIITLQDLRRKEIKMPKDVSDHLSREDIDLIRLLLTHDVEARPTSEKLTTSIGLKEREYQGIIKQVVQNRQARTHKHMLRLLFEQNGSYVDDFVFDYEDADCLNNETVSARSDLQSLLKDFNANAYALDQVKMKLEQLLRSKGFVSFVAPILLPKYSASKYYTKQRLEDCVMLMDKNSSILTLPYDLRLPFARYISRANVNYMNRFAIERIFRQRPVLGYHPDQFWECCVDIVSPPLSSGFRSQIADAEILNLIGEVVKSLPVLYSLKPILRVSHIRLVKAILGTLGFGENQMDDLLTCISESLSVSLKRVAQFLNPPNSQSQSQSQSQSYTHHHHNLSSSSLPIHVRDDLKKDLVASKLATNVNIINTLINFLDIVGDTAAEVYNQLEQGFNSRGLRTVKYLEEARGILRDIDETICYANGLGLDLPIRISPGFVLGALRSVEFYSGLVFSLECKRSIKIRNKMQPSKTVILAVGGRYDQLINNFSRNRSEVLDQVYSGEIGDCQTREQREKGAVGVSFEVEKLARFVLEDHIEKVYNQENYVPPQLHQLVQTNISQAPAFLSTSTPSSSLSVRFWPQDIVICSLATNRTRAITGVMSGLVKQLRERGLKCYEITPQGSNSFTLDSLSLHCLENKIPYIITVKFQTVMSMPGDDFLQAPATDDDNSLSSSPNNSSILAPASPKAPPSPIIPNCTAILYQMDRSNRLKEMKRCDVQNIVDHLFKR